MKSTISSLYSPNDLETMRLAEAARIPGKNRVEEIRKYGRSSGIRRIGVAFCLSLRKEAELLKQMLSDEFEIIDIGCKTGQITSAELLGTDAKGISCNPAGQAEYLGENATELNISFGLCLGHDIVFNGKSKAPVTTLVVKDREHRHNPYKTFENSSAASSSGSMDSLKPGMI